MSQIQPSGGAWKSGAWRECILVFYYLLSSRPGQNFSTGHLAPRSWMCLNLGPDTFWMSDLASGSFRFLLYLYYNIEIIASTLKGYRKGYLSFDHVGKNRCSKKKKKRFFKKHITA